jgi:hypothetical protein
MGELRKFPGRLVTPGNNPVTVEGRVIEKCEGIIHVFESVPGRCQCGEELWAEISDDAVGIHHPDE